MVEIETFSRPVAFVVLDLLTSCGHLIVIVHVLWLHQVTWLLGHVVAHGSWSGLMLEFYTLPDYLH